MERTKILILLLFIIFLLGIGLYLEKIIDSQLVIEPVNIDGNDQEWKREDLNYEKDTKIWYGFKNDEAFLYVVLIFEDPKYLSSIEQTGITLFFNPEGKKKKIKGVHFYKKFVPPEEAIAEIEKQGKILSEEEKQSLRTKAGAIFFAAEPVKQKGRPLTETLVTSAGSNPIFKTSSLGPKVVYEFKIPLSCSDLQPLGIGASLGQTIAINFEWGGMTEAMRKAVQAREREVLARGLDKEGGAGTIIIPGKEENTINQLKNISMPKKYNFWCLIKLASAK